MGRPIAAVTPWKSWKIANDRIAAVIVTPMDQPVLKNTYRFERHITAPMAMPTITARSVSWAAPGL